MVYSNGDSFLKSSMCYRWDGNAVLLGPENGALPRGKARLAHRNAPAAVTFKGIKRELTVFSRDMDWDVYANRTQKTWYSHSPRCNFAWDKNNHSWTPRPPWRVLASNTAPRNDPAILKFQLLRKQQGVFPRILFVIGIRYSKPHQLLSLGLMFCQLYELCIG